jgi:hypothetical protein
VRQFTPPMDEETAGYLNTHHQKFTAIFHFSRDVLRHLSVSSVSRVVLLHGLLNRGGYHHLVLVAVNGRQLISVRHLDRLQVLRTRTAQQSASYWVHRGSRLLRHTGNSPRVTMDAQPGRML